MWGKQFFLAMFCFSLLVVAPASAQNDPPLEEEYIDLAPEEPVKIKPKSKEKQKEGQPVITIQKKKKVEKKPSEAPEGQASPEQSQKTQPAKSEIEKAIEKLEEPKPAPAVPTTAQPPVHAPAPIPTPAPAPLPEPKIIEKEIPAPPELPANINVISVTGATAAGTPTTINVPTTGPLPDGGPLLDAGDTLVTAVPLTFANYPENFFAPTDRMDIFKIYTRSKEGLGVILKPENLTIIFAVEILSEAGQLLTQTRAARAGETLSFQTTPFETNGLIFMKVKDLSFDSPQATIEPKKYSIELRPVVVQ